MPSDSNSSNRLTRSQARHSSNHNNVQEILSSDDQNSKRKLLTADSDDTSVSSKTRQKNETSTVSSTSDDDFRIKIRTRKSLLNETEKSATKSSKHKSHSHKTNDITINYNPTTILNETSLEDSLTIAQDISPMDEDRILKDVIENNDNESIFASLDIAQDKSVERTNNPDIEDISNDGILPSPLEDFSDDR